MKNKIIKKLNHRSAPFPQANKPKTILTKNSRDSPKDTGARFPLTPVLISGGLGQTRFQ